MLLDQITNEFINKTLKNNVDGCEKIVDYGTNITYENLERFFIKMIILSIIFIVAKITIFYTIQKKKSKAKIKPDVVKSVKDMDFWEFRRYKKECEAKGVFDNKTDIIVSVADISDDLDVDVPEVVVQSDEVEELAKQAAHLFNRLLKNKELKRKDILAIKDYLKSHVKVPKGKKYNNDVHFIYSTLKHASLKKEIVKGMIKFLQNKIVVEEDD